MEQPHVVTVIIQSELLGNVRSYGYDLAKEFGLYKEESIFTVVAYGTYHAQKLTELTLSAVVVPSNWVVT